jgi:hypothetical protein
VPFYDKIVTKKQVNNIKPNEVLEPEGNEEDDETKESDTQGRIILEEEDEKKELKDINMEQQKEEKKDNVADIGICSFSSFKNNFTEYKNVNHTLNDMRNSSLSDDFDHNKEEHPINNLNTFVLEDNNCNMIYYNKYLNEKNDVIKSVSLEKISINAKCINKILSPKQIEQSYQNIKNFKQDK